MQWDYYNIDDNDAEVNQYVSKNVFVCDVKTKTERKKNKIKYGVNTLEIIQYDSLYLSNSNDENV